MQFLQSPEWEEIQRRMGRPTKRVGSVLVVTHELPFGFRYLYTPRPEHLPREFFSDAAECARVSGALFLKVDPADHSAPHHAVPSRSLQPPATILLSCRANEGMLLQAMHPKTRYNIRVADRHGVHIRRVLESEIQNEFHLFAELMQHTARRDGFTPHPEEHYRALLDVRSDTFKNELWYAEWGGQILSAVMVNWFLPSRTATYLHGGSANEHREVMASYALHWEIIREAKKRGYDTYDLGGIDQKRWPGVTRFKSGFGGSQFDYPPSYDVPFRGIPYYFYRFQNSLRHRH